MRIRPGYTLDIVQADLDYALQKWKNLYSDQNYLFGRYIQTVTDTHDRLAQAIAEPRLAEGLLAGHYWQLVEMRGATELHGILVLEVQQQIAAIEDAQRQLKELRAYAGRPGVPVVYDTNMLNHWKQPEDVDWKTLLSGEGLDGKRARLVVPLVVIDELDRQKYGDGALARRAATAIRYLERKLDRAAPGEAVKLREGVTLEVRLDPPGHRRAEPDLEILRCAADLDGLVPGVGVRVLTDDYGMRLRAQSMGLATLRLPAAYRKASTGMDTASHEVPAPARR
ncbi:PIN domain-containing protein [Kitasatospora sp. NPDC091257]|uniref:PIN domain-containing protein n=1 Tax=Kitasatospora sp. NPDC091257 TaxID=3364084 RepID=UPI00380E96D5